MPASPHYRKYVAYRLIHCHPQHLLSALSIESLMLTECTLILLGVQFVMTGGERLGLPGSSCVETYANSLAAKQCYHCQGLGHVQADCPTLRLSGAGTSGRCYSCGLTGHLARNCPNPGAGMGRGAAPPRGGFGGFRGGFSGGPRPATCYKCGGPNHFARDCQAQAMKCYACGKLGKCYTFKRL